MERLRSALPENLQLMIAQSSPDDLHTTCSNLCDFFFNLELFNQVVATLTSPESRLCGKSKESSLQLKKKGNDAFNRKDYEKALSFYSQICLLCICLHTDAVLHMEQALRFAPVDASDMEKNLIAVLYMNRASVLHNLGFLLECIRDCNRSLAIYPGYAKAWYRKGKTNVCLENYEDAAHDLNLAMNLERSLPARRQIESELNLLLSSGKGMPSSQSNSHKQANMPLSDELPRIKLECVSTPMKGRGMASKYDIAHASLVHAEKPYAAIISKQCRETHCNYCFNELPVDIVPCPSCSTPLYCSQHCQRKAGNCFWNHQKTGNIYNTISSNREKNVVEAELDTEFKSEIEWVVEHSHECEGVNWPVVLPSEVVLAGRVFVKSILQRRHSIFNSELMELSHNFGQMPPERKMELHIYSIVLLCCLQNSYLSEIQLNGAYMSQLVILLSQIRVNSMAVSRIKTSKRQFSQPSKDDITDCVQQVRVGQAVYLSGSLFNHSCVPNVHAYFLSRTLFIRSTEFVAAGYPLELSYGPQLGQWDCKDRRQFLEDIYSFRCHCIGCSKINLSDLVINAFRCVKPHCFGIILDSSTVNSLAVKENCFEGSDLDGCILMKDKTQMTTDISKEVHSVSGRTSFRLEPGVCLRCGSCCDLECSVAAISKAGIYRRSEDIIVSKDDSHLTLSHALNSLNLLRSKLHVYNKSIAEAEDNVAKALCLVGDLEPAVDHCKESIKVLEKLYGANHIAIGFELVKLSTIQLSVGDCASVESIRRLCSIFSCYYGPHAEIMFPNFVQMSTI